MGKSAKKKRQKLRKKMQLGRDQKERRQHGPDKSSSHRENSRNEDALHRRDQLSNADMKGTGSTNPPEPEVAANASKKRSRRTLEFVYPKQNGTQDPYIFERRHNLNGIKDSSETTTQSSSSPIEMRHRVQAERQNEVKNESIDDILFSSKGKRLRRLSEELYKKESEMTQEMLNNDTVKVGEDGVQLTDNRTQDAVTHPQHENENEGKLSGLSVEDVVRDRSGCRPRANSTDGELNLPRRGLCDERMVLQAHRWDLSSQIFVRSSPKGLTNLGNTCFLNSVLQCLAYLPPFCQSLLAMPDHAKNDNGHQKISQGKRITSMLRSLFQKIHSHRHQFNGTDALTPGGMVKALPTIGTCGSRNGYVFRPGRQEDAHEFLIHLLDAMNDGELREAGINQHASGWRGRLPVPRLDETTIIHRIFGGYLRSQVRCTKCGYCSNTYDPFLDLALEVSKKSTDSVADAFKEFTRKETLDSENRWKCSGCNKRVCATKQLTVFRPPLSLCVQMKRFAYGGLFGGKGFGGFSKGFGLSRGNKVSKPIGFPAEMNLPLSDGRFCGYHLTGVVVHVGGSSDSGHYTAYVKKPLKSEKFQWYQIDDSFVEAVSERTVLHERDAYLLFYCRKEVKLEFPSPPRRISASAEEAAEHGRARARARADSLTREEVEGREDVTAIKNGTLQGPQMEPGEKTSRLVARKNTDKGIESPKTLGITLLDGGGNGSTTSKRAESSPVHYPGLETKNTKQAESLEKHSVGLETKSKERSESKQKETTDHKERSVEEASLRGPKKVAEEPTSSGGDSESSSSDTDSSSDDSSSATSSSSSSTSPLDRDDSLSQSKSSTRLLGPETQKDDERNREEKLPIKEKTSLSKPKQKKGRVLTRVVMDCGRGREKVSVMLGPRHKTKKSWKPQTTGTALCGQEYELLGNRSVDKWDDDGEVSGQTSEALNNVSQARAQIVKNMEKDKQSQKRKSYLDRWDASLDRGRAKKIKQKRDNANIPTEPDNNAFQRVLSSLKKVRQHRPKGFLGKQKKKNRNHRKR